ncbi:MAG: amidohydrolase [Pseudomonadota bacterium]
MDRVANLGAHHGLECGSECDTEYSVDLWAPPRHSADPFACPCCANVFQETLQAIGTDLAVQGLNLKRAMPRVGTAVVINAKILTMNPAQPEAQAMWIEEGQIRWLGASADLPADAPLDAVIDAEGRFLMPGFIDPHMHLAPLAMLHSFQNVGPFRFETVAQVVDHLRGVAAQTPAGDWIVGRQFDPSLQSGADELTIDFLDEVSTEHPVFVYNASLHLAYCNSAALELAGIDRDTASPPNSEIGRFADGRPNGVLKAGPAMALVARYNPYVRNQDVAQGCLQVFEHAASLGLTMLCDQGTGLFQGVKELDLYRGLRDSNRMAVRFRYSLGQAISDQWDQVGVNWGQGDAWLRNSGWKIVSDGSNQGRTGLQREPFLGGQSRGMAYIEEDELQAAVVRRLREGWAVCVHANGDAAIDRVLTAFELAKSQGLDPAAMRCRIEHCSILHDDQIERMAALGVSPSFLIGHVYYWGAAFVNDVFGLEKAELLDRTGACEAKGIRWTVHSDDPVTEMNPLRCIQNAVTRSMWRADELLSPQECISVEAGLRAMTIDAAWQCHSDHEFGSLEVGKFGDFVVLDADPRAVDPNTLMDINVLETWVNGVRVYNRAAAEG